jgi:uncharacterized membrane protein HdeD (DUF308 family)
MVANKVDAYVERTNRGPLALESLAAIAIGILLIVFPKNATQLLVILFGLFWIIYGVSLLLSLFRNHKEWGWRLAGGIGSIILGVLLATHSLWSAYLGSAVLVWLFAAAGCVIGIIMILKGIAYREWGKAILGFIALAAGFLLVLVAPGASLLVPVLIGAAAILCGGYGLIAAIRKPAKQA